MAETDFRNSITLAHRMCAKVYELPSKVSLARLLAALGCGKEAYATLAEFYNLFTEGFDTPDLKDAKALLKDLAT